MKSILKVAALVGLLFGTAGAASTDTVSENDIKDRIVELTITFRPSPKSESAKKRKQMGMKTAGAICSGAFISPTGDIITAKHCVEDSLSIEVRTTDQQNYTARVVAISPHQDLAMIHVDKFNSPCFNRIAPVLQGQAIFVFGSPLGITNTLTKGTVAKLDGDLTLIDCTVLPGNSGGPVFDAQGRLIGVVSSVYVVMAGVTHLGNAQSSDSIFFFITSLRAFIK